MARYDYHKPATLAAALELGGSGTGARYLAGGTDLLVQIRARGLRPSALVSLRAIAELRGIEVDDCVRIGAATTLAEIAGHPSIVARYPLLAQAARTVGSPQIRNVATIGGNLCNASPCADTAPALLVLGASVVLQGPGGQRRIALEDFFTGPGQTCMARGELLHSIQLPPPRTAARGRFVKKTRVGMDLAKESIAVLVEQDGLRCTRARVAVGSVAPVPLRLRQTEELLEGATVDSATLTTAGDTARAEVSPITDLRSTDGYRRQLVGTLLVRSLRDLLQGGAP